MAKLRHKILAEKLQIKRYFYMEYITLYTFGFDCTATATERILHRPWLSFSTVFAISLIMIGMIHYSYVHMPNIEQVTDALTPLVQGILIGSKFIILFVNRREVVDLIHRIWKLTENANEIEVKILSEENKPISHLNVIYSCLVIVAGIICTAALPLIGALFYIFKGKFEYIVILTATYPIRLDDPLNYAIIYAWSTYGVFAMVCVAVGADTIFIWSAQNIAAQFRILSHRLKLLPMYSSCTSKDIIRKSIVDCVKYHHQTIHLAKDFDRVYYLLTFTEVSLGSVQTCLLVFQLGRNIDASRAFFLAVFLVLELLRLLVFSYCGQHIEDESKQVAVTAFENIQWQLWSIKECKMMILVILRSQRSCKITGVFFYVNMGLFIMILRTAASYIALLRSIGDVEK